MPKGLLKKEPKQKKKSAPVKKEVSSLRKLKMLITVVDRTKTLFYQDLLEQFEVNFQMVLYGKGTANSQMLARLGLIENEKAIIISYIREDMVKEALEMLNEKFSTVKNGKGVAYTISMYSLIGVSSYQLLSNDKTVKEGGKNNEKKL